MCIGCVFAGIPANKTAVLLQAQSVVGIVNCTFANCLGSVAQAPANVTLTTARVIAVNNIVTTCAKHYEALNNPLIVFDLNTRTRNVGTPYTNIVNSESWGGLMNAITTEMTDDAEYRDYANLDYRLHYNSPARFAGIPAGYDCGALQFPHDARIRA